MARIRWIVVILVHRHSQHGRVLQERMLLTVPMVYVPIDDRHALAAMDELGPLSNQYVVGEHTEAACHVLLGMVARRSNEAVDILDLPFHHRIETLEGAAGR